MEETSDDFIDQKPGDITALIASSYGQLRPAERCVADIVLEDVERAAEASSIELAVWAVVSESTVARFCRAIGFRSLRDLQKRLHEN